MDGVREANKGLIVITNRLFFAFARIKGRGKKIKKKQLQRFCYSITIILFFFFSVEWDAA